jgi:uncharacterized hydrophobic protein (TIGR00271 family)
VLVHLRVTVPGALTTGCLALLRGHDYTTNVTLQRGASLDPVGDVLEADVAREELNEVLESLHRLGVGRQGGILVQTPVATPFDEATRMEERAPGDPDDTVIWDSVLAKADAGARPTVSYLMFMVMAVVLAGIAVILDSSILVVGAMVVGPEFSAVGAVAVGAAFGRWRLVGRGLRLLIGGFGFAIVVATALALVARLTGLATIDMVTAPRPQTGFIWHPDRWSFIVALIAGAAGALAMAIEKVSTMVGVFISVTTIPAAGNLALGLAFWTRHEIVGSAVQLVLNLTCMIVAGLLVLGYQRLFWTRTLIVADRFFHSAERRAATTPETGDAAR